jgi:muconolactone delta-isomerase
VNGLLKLAIEGHGGLRRWERLSRFRVAASITGAIWTLRGQPGLLDGVVLAGETRDQRLTITPFPRYPWMTIQTTPLTEHPSDPALAGK